MSDERIQVSDRELARRHADEQAIATKQYVGYERTPLARMRPRRCECSPPIVASDLDGERRCIKCGREL